MENRSNKTLYFVHEWIGPRGPLINSRVPHIYDLMKRMPHTQWDRCWMTDDFDPMVMRYRDFTNCKIIPSYDFNSIGDNQFIYELTLSMRNGFDLIALQSGIGILDSTPMDYSVLQAVRRRQGWIVVSNLLESFLEDITLGKIHNYFMQHQIPLDRVIYLTNCLNGQEVYENFCQRHNLQPEVRCEYAGVYLLDFIHYANEPEFVNREYVVGPRDKLFLMFNRRYRPHRFHILLRLYEHGLLDDCHISFSEAQPDDSSAWMDHAVRRCQDDNINLNASQLEDLQSKLPLVLDTDKFNSFPMEQQPYDTHQFYDESLIHIVSETNFDTNIIHITEKTMKPIMFKQPFVIVGAPNSLKHLRSMGYKTFGDIWDESYDEEFDHRTRMEKVVNLLLAMSRLTAHERVQLAASVKEIVDYNFEQLRNREAVEVQQFTDKYGN